MALHMASGAYDNEIRDIVIIAITIDVMNLKNIFKSGVATVMTLWLICHESGASIILIRTEICGMNFSKAPINSCRLVLASFGAEIEAAF